MNDSPGGKNAQFAASGSFSLIFRKLIEEKINKKKPLSSPVIILEEERRRRKKNS